MLSGSGRWPGANAAFVMAILAVLTITAAGCGGRSGGEAPDVPVTPTVLRPAVTGPPSTPEKASTPSVPSVSPPSPSPRREAASSPSPTPVTAASAAPAATTAAEAERSPAAAPASEVAAAPAATPAPGATAAPAAAGAAATMEYEAPGSPSGGGAEDGPYVPVSISAGEVDDNEQWEEYLRYRLEFQGPRVHNVDVSERYAIAVADAGGRPVPNAVVRVSTGETLLFQGRTYANGQTLFFPRAYPTAEGVEQFRLYVERNGVSQNLDVARGERSDWVVTLDTTVSYDDGVPLDILFLLDSTGSMADEINQITETLLSISSRIADLPSQPDLRFGMVSYRDRGDEYVTRVYEFDRDVSRFLEAVRGVHADGGDDEPESLNEALHVAVQEPEWRLDDAVRLVFLVADAPPHLDYPQDYDYAVEMAEAKRRGIKIFSVATSGLNAQGEYIFRQIAQHTMGRFIFLLYEGEGGTPSTPHDVGGYTVERLDDLVVRLVEEELAALPS